MHFQTSKSFCCAVKRLCYPMHVLARALLFVLGNRLPGKHVKYIYIYINTHITSPPTSANGKKKCITRCFFTLFIIFFPLSAQSIYYTSTFCACAIFSFLCVCVCARAWCFTFWVHCPYARHMNEHTNTPLSIRVAQWRPLGTNFFLLIYHFFSSSYPPSFVTRMYYSLG
ncbi:T. brucei spp.-specific protein [Trypanosoma brucei gambiense DAL972]|uniref:T. brucei spp.-specific protein n=1 Tax=Trypanosoma brucei gambiense (strain MHOM/CI/86/DAL972) TaxID=679716 RepID=C9ZIP7_TRYB9|nr:T. brucei spp.-specific protein [Trypanosoma brucei gambiense DAL972]CBH09039.1 T. brucei spp.-specific protein [Trypanosoma brucei gambiense DAL972]|eukprot:XP_011771480.1 T. brucei spp.-specific protein [Trypanosoma brucei gambiense DAL972]